MTVKCWIFERFPEFNEKLSFPRDEQNFEILMDSIKAIRSRRAEMNVPPSRKAVHLIVVTDRSEIFESGRVFLMKFAYAGEISVTNTCTGGCVEGMVSVVTGEAKMFMPMADLVDLAKERERIEKELEKAQKEYDGQMAKSSQTKASLPRHRKRSSKPKRTAQTRRRRLLTI